MTPRAANGMRPPPGVAQCKIGWRVLRAGDRVKIKGERGALFKILRFDLACTEVTVYGGAPNHERMRTFLVGRIGERPRAANRKES